MKLHIGNLPTTLSEPQLKNLVVLFAEPSALEIVRNDAGESRGYGYAEFASADEGRAAIKGLDGREVSGQKLKVGEARPRKSDAKRIPTPQA